MNALFPDLEPVAAAPAAYRVLARKYRPTTFHELIGQDVVVRTLTHAIETGRLAQAWMLTGVRGVGKTTTARIIARALNCTGADGKGDATPDPCGVCGNCTAIAADRHVDVLEMDAASRTGVDDIREIIDGVRYNPVNARYKIYIIDEVHMLTKNAFNALLKTLEEPPPHVKFIFATTEIRKVPVTVLSRCQRFDLRRVEAKLLAEHFKNISAKENVAIEAEALAMIARAADGSVRDGLSLLDQAIARGGDAVSGEAVQDMLGLADRTQTMLLAKHIFQGEMPDGLAAYADALRGGADPLTLLQDMAELVHLLTRARLLPDLAQSAELPEIEKHFIRDAGGLDIPALTRAWQILLKGIAEVQASARQDQAAEMVLIRLAYAAALPTPGDLVKKIQQEQTASSMMPTTPNGGGHGGTIMQVRGNVALAAYNPEPAPRIMAQEQPQAETALLAAPDDFPGLVRLFAEQREINIYNGLYNYAHLVKMEAGRLELFLEPAAAPDLAARAAALLTKWTGQRWIVTLAREGSAPTLADAERARKQAADETVTNHPLVQATLVLFPGAKIATIRHPAPVAALTEKTADDSDAATDIIEPTEEAPE